MIIKAILLLLICLRQAHGLTQDYCNSELPSNAHSTASSNFMSNGLCMSQCQGYKYAIVQGKECWCSNSTPQDTVSVSNCDSICPGYKIESCGGGTTYYGWLKVSNDYILGSSATSFSYESIGTGSTSAASSSSFVVSSSQSSSYASSAVSEGTSSSSIYSSYSVSDSSAGSSSYAVSSTSSESSSSTTSSESSSSTTSSESSSSTTSKFSAPSSTSSTSSSTSSSSSTSPSSTIQSSTSSTSTSTVTKTSDSASQSSMAQATLTTVEVTTIMPSTHTTSDSDGSKITSAAQPSVESIYKTIVVSTTVVPSNTRATPSTKSKGFWQSKGKVAGTFVVVALVILLLIVLCVFFFFVKPRRENRKQDEFEKTYNEIIQANLRDSVENDAKLSSGTLAVNNALKGFQEFDSDASSNIEHKNMHPEPEETHNFIPDYDMISEQGTGYSASEPDEDLLAPRRQSLGPLKVVNMSTTTIDQVKKE